MAKIEAQKSQRRAAATYAALALLIVGPWLKPGYIFALDMVFTPQLRMPDTLTSSYLFHAFLHVINFVVPSQIIEKFILFAIFFLSGFGAYRLAQSLPGNRLSSYAAGLLYAVNPFTYDRLMTGQYSVLLGYALLPFFVQSLLSFLQKPRLRQAITLALLATLIGIISIHTLGPIFIIGVSASVIWLVKHRYKRDWRSSFWKYAVGALGGFALLNSYWLVPLLTGKGATSAQVASFTGGDTAAFATLGDSFIAKLGNVLSLHGFWAENHDLYLLPNQQITTWGVLILLLWTVAIVGAVQWWRAGKRTLVALFGSLVIIGSLLAVGFGIGVLAQHVSAFAGFREPQKFAGLIALGLATFFGAGASFIAQYMRDQFESHAAANVAAAFLLLVPAIITSTMWWGARGQLQAQNYPPEWAAVNAKLNADPSNFNTIFLPWHLYMRFDFAGRVITNPAPEFFDKPVIVSDQAELGETAAVKPSDTKRQLDALLKNSSNNKEIAAQLGKLKVKYIIVDREEDYAQYNFVNHTPGLQKVGDYGLLALYRNDAYGGDE